MSSGQERLDQGGSGSRTRRLLFLLPLLVFAVVAGYFVWGLTDPDRDPNVVRSAMVGKMAPDIDLAPVEGLGLPGLGGADLRSGKPLLVNFFASWCIPCRAEHPLLMDLAEAGEIEIVGINYQDKPADAIAWLAELGNPYSRVGADPRSRGGIDFGVSGVPETFVIDGEGRIRHQQIGPITQQILDEDLRPLFEELAP